MTTPKVGDKVRVVAWDELCNTAEIASGEKRIGSTGEIVYIDPPEKRYKFPIDVKFDDGEVLGFTANEIEVVA